MRATLALGVTGLIVGILLQLSRPDTASAQTTRPSTQPAQREIRIKFVNTNTGEPLSGVVGSYWPDQQKQDNNYTIHVAVLRQSVAEKRNRCDPDA